MNTELTTAVNAARDKAQYDVYAKRLLAKRRNNMNKEEMRKILSKYIVEERGDIGRFMDAQPTIEKPYEPEKINYNPEKELAPIGTVVIGYNFENPNNNITYDYIACKYPNGIESQFSIYYFNHDEIDRYYSIGYTDSEQKKFIEELQNKIQKGAVK